MDGLTMRRLTIELASRLQGSKIEKIYQPGERDLVLSVRQSGVGTAKLFLSAHKQFARVHFLAEERPDNPQEPPMFCRFLRKHIEGGRIVDVVQHDWDRVIEFRIEGIDELGDVRVYSLICELMGRHSNILLCREEQDRLRIMDAIVRVTEAMSRHREVLPGAPYIAPPAQHKATYLDTTADALTGLDALQATSRANAMYLVERVAGLGPVSAREILHRANVGDTSAPFAERVAQNLHRLVDVVMKEGEAASVSLDELGRATECAPFFLTHRHNYAACPSMSEAIRRRFADTGQVMYHSHLQDELRRVVDDAIDKLRGKRLKLEQSLTESADEGIYRIKAELLTAYAYQVEKGETRVVLENYYEDNAPMAIDLDPAFDAIENAQRYFKQATKRKRAASLVAEQLDATNADMRYLEEVLESLRDAGIENLEQIRRELVSQGFLQERQTKHKGKGKPQKSTKDKIESKPDMYISEDGLVIRVGRNNLQNDRLTLRQSDKDDLWLHVKDQPGSHVVVEKGDVDEIPETTVEEAALLAAYFSRGRDSSSVAVDITRIRHVWKPNGARPGLVLYDHQRTLFVTPDRSLVEPILVRRADGEPSHVANR